MTDNNKVVEVTEKVKSNVEGVDVHVTVGNFSVFREVVKVASGWAMVNPFKMPDTTIVFPTKDEAIKAVSDLIN